MTNIKLKNLKPGEVFDAGIVEIEVLEHFDNGRTLLVTKESIGNRPFTVRPFTYNRTDSEPNPNNFAYSSLCYDLNTDFLEALSNAGVILVDKVIESEWSLADHDGTNRYGVAVCKVAMLTEPMIRKYYDAGLLKIDGGEWTITPYSSYEDDVCYVVSDGRLYSNDAWRGICGVRPALFVDSEICLFLEPDEVELSDTALLREYTSKQLIEEVLRRIAAGEEGEQFEVDRKRPRIEVEIDDEYQTEKPEAGSGL